LSGTNDTVISPSGSEGGCACGRVHNTAAARRRGPRAPEVNLPGKIYDAICVGRAEHLEGFGHSLALSGDCQIPFRVAANDGEHIFAERFVRCRRCAACLRARTNYWGFAGMEQTRLAAENGGRTWFGTLTLSAEWQAEFLDRARSIHCEPNASWWEEPHCDERFKLVRALLLKEVQRYWKRLRKDGHRFKYLVVFERHKSGLPHMHFLLHEQGRPILKRELEARWPYGHSKCVIVGGRSRRAAAPEKAAWYVVKYLSKSTQARQLASRGYKPIKRS
jgi:hypothetical protein